MSDLEKQLIYEAGYKAGVASVDESAIIERFIAEVEEE